MRGRKPKLDNVVPMRPDDPDGHEALRLAATERAIRNLRPKGLSSDLRKEWTRVARLLAEPTVDRLKPRFVDVIIEYCRATVRLRMLRLAFQAAAEKKAKETGQPADPLAAEVYRVEAGRNGTQVKTHPYIPQINETWRQWRSLVAMLGLSPADERNMIPGQGDLFDESDRYLA
jgi:phage terminase small subunit